MTVQITYRLFERLLHECPWCDGLCARDPGTHQCTQCLQWHTDEGNNQ